MITVLTGENDYELTMRRRALAREFEGEVIRRDAQELERADLADMFAGQTLFSTKRLVLIDEPSASSELWGHLADWMGRVADDTHVVLIEPKLDKRTSAYKWLKAHADIQECRPIASSDSWLEQYAKGKSVTLTDAQLRTIASRVGNDQWQLAEVIDKLALLDEITDQWITDVIQSTPSENVFALFETTLSGDVTRTHELVQALSRSEDPYKLIGLLSSQAVSLVTLSVSRKAPREVAADLGLKSAYPLEVLAPHARRLSLAQSTKIIQLLAGVDDQIKSSDADPWLVLESALVQIASLK